MIRIDNVECHPGEIKEVLFHPFDMPIELPATLICGKEEGKTLLVCAQAHSGEYNGSVATMDLAKEIDPKQLKGNLLLFHCVNITGFWQRKHRYVPEDMSNLNANFPGNEHGTIGNKIAAWFVKEVFPHVDFLADLHNGKDNDLLESCLFYPRAEKVTQAALEAAKKLNVKYLLASSNAKGLYGYAANYCDIPGFIIECGYGCAVRKEWADRHKQNVRLLMKHLEMYDYTETVEWEEQKIYPRSEYVTFDHRGVWLAAVVPNQKVKKGDLLGSITDFFGNEIKSYYAEYDGTIIYLITGLCVLEGDEAIAYGIDE